MVAVNVYSGQNRIIILSKHLFLKPGLLTSPTFQILVTGLKVPTPGVKQDKLVMAAE